MADGTGSHGDKVMRYGVVDRARWQSGPWHSEPDRVEWRRHGLACLMVRGPVGAWCGYVALPEGHPWRALDLQMGDGDVSVHGGITYGPSPCAGDICHVTEEHDDVRWVGFDCCHSGDYHPLDRSPSASEVYRTTDYVIAEVESLADQAKAAQETGP